MSRRHAVLALATIVWMKRFNVDTLWIIFGAALLTYLIAVTPLLALGW
jgi:hypothetical protein